MSRDQFALLYPRLRRFAAIVGSLGSDPDDLVQEALASMLRRDLAPEHPEAFLRRSIVNLAISQSRRRSRWRDRVPKIATPADYTDVYPSDADVLDHLDPVARVVLWLIDAEGWASAEVAQMLGMTDAAVRQRAARARRRLRQLVASEESP